MSDSPVGYALRTDHRLVVKRVDMLGGDRMVAMSSGLNIVRGDISSGKTTFVRLLKALLSVVPSSMPPEVDSVRALLANLQLRDSDWSVYRPITTTADAPVEVAKIDPTDPEPEAIRLKARGVDGSYSRFLLDQLGLPAVVVPEGTVTTARLNPVSITDWLGYCIVTGDDLDSEVFGHRDPFSDRKRRTVYELIYGYYDTELSDLLAQRRGLELKLTSLDQEDEVIRRFLAGTPFEDGLALETHIAVRREALNAVESLQRDMAWRSGEGASEIGEFRGNVLALRSNRDELNAAQIATGGQLEDLDELARQLRSQSARLTRAIVSDEWLVDFDFLVCPRCGNNVEPSTTDSGVCYLCHQPEVPGASKDLLLAEQGRVVSQIDETVELIEGRRREFEGRRGQLEEIDQALSYASRHLDQLTQTFVSDQASALQAQAREQARLQSEIAQLIEYNALLRRQDARDGERAELERELADVLARAEARTSNLRLAEENTEALEARFLEYLERLSIPQLGDTLTARINRTTYMPEVSTRSFDELSSQGLKTLVNVAHALAHHTVAIDRGLPLPGLLVLDGLSANAGHQGFDQARVDDLYRLILDVSAAYQETLQLVIVDNDLPSEMEDELEPFTVLPLSQTDRLIRNPGAGGAGLQSETPG